VEYKAQVSRWFMVCIVTGKSESYVMCFRAGGAFFGYFYIWGCILGGFSHSKQDMKSLLGVKLQG
jgi:hypothetical protein